MKKFFLTTALCFLVTPVFAQGSTITIIHEDGSQDVIDLGGDAPKPAPAPKAPPKIVEEPIAAPDPVAETAPKVEPEKPQIKAEELLEEKPVTPQKVEKPKSVQKEVKKAAPKKAAPKKTIKKADVPKPRRKPYRAPVAAETVPVAPALITKQKALYIALEAAPPSKDVEVLERGQNYTVIFTGDEIVHEVLVDRNSGVIVSTERFEKSAQPREPGVLPRPIPLPANRP